MIFLDGMCDKGDVLKPLPFLCFIITIMHVLHVISRCNVYSCAIMWLSPITAGWSCGTSPLSPIHVCHNPDPAVPYPFLAVQFLRSWCVFILMTFMTFMTLFFTCVSMWHFLGNHEKPVFYPKFDGSKLSKQ